VLSINNFEDGYELITLMKFIENELPDIIGINRKFINFEKICLVSVAGKVPLIPKAFTE